MPITDLEKWATQNANYREHVFACCSNDVNEMKKRTPINYMKNIAKANLKIFHGKFDAVVPVSQSLELYKGIMLKYPGARVFLDIFDGGHEIDIEAAFYWLISQYKGVKKEKVTG